MEGAFITRGANKSFTCGIVPTVTLDVFGGNLMAKVCTIVMTTIP